MVARRTPLWLVGLVGLAVLSSACSSGDTANADAFPSPTATVPAPPPLTDVVVRPDVRAISIADDDVLTKRTGRLAMDEAAVSAVAQELTTLLQADLDDRNRGGAGTLVALAGDVIAADAAAFAQLEALASVDNPATELDVDVEMGVDVLPRWVTATLDVTRRDGTHRTLTVVLAVDSSPWQVLLVGADEVNA